MIEADALSRLVSHLRRHADDELDEINGAAGADIVVTHDGTTLSAYGATRHALESGASAISEVLADRGQQVEIVEARWDQCDGDLRRQCREVRRSRVRSRDRARREASRPRVHGHRAPSSPHDAVAFTVAGPRLEVDQLHKDMIHAGWRTIANAEALIAPWAGP